MDVRFNGVVESMSIEWVQQAYLCPGMATGTDIVLLAHRGNCLQTDQ